MNPSKNEDWAYGWYCLRAKPKQENVAARTLATLEEVEVFLPKTVRARKKNAPPAQALFPGYFFARFDPIAHLRSVQYSRGVAYVVRRKEKPVSVPPALMDELRTITNDGLLEIKDRPHNVGDEVSVIAGIFKGGLGKVTRLLPARERVKVLLEFLGRETEVEINEDSLDFPSTHAMEAC